ncbi:MAG TPA: hypothetical protein VKU82_09095 [Planctomycetaceae bacterium]|nr:hypothetical protein [Planctomycetaceae bacterium]
METFIRNVGDIDAHDRQALERVLGQSLRENQQLVIGIVNPQVPPQGAQEPLPRGINGAPALPEWCNVYAGLSDEEIADIEAIILRATSLGCQG